MESEDIVEYEEDEEFEDEDGDMSLAKLKEGANRKKGRGLDDSARGGAARDTTMEDYDEIDEDETSYIPAGGPG